MDADSRKRRIQITTLPQQLLDQILTPHTSIQDKQALRLVCRLFQQTVDGNLVCLFIKDKEGILQRAVIEQFFRRIGHVPSIVLDDVDSSWLTCLPGSIHTLAYSTTMHLCCQELERLRCLRNLCIDSWCGVRGLEGITGLTSLRCSKPVGSLAHLAPTLKQLSIGDGECSIGVNQLTRLEALEWRCKVPADFFETHGQLQLRHLCVAADLCTMFLGQRKAWQSAPTTLTRLALDYARDKLVNALPASITHLQMLVVHCHNIRYAAAALPGLRRLDLHLYTHELDYSDHLNTFSSLTSLGLCVMRDRYCDEAWSRDTILQQLPGVSKAVARGVTLTAMTCCNGTSGEGWHQCTAARWGSWQLPYCAVTHVRMRY